MYVDGQSLEQIPWQQTLEALDSVAKREIIPAENIEKWLKSWGSKNELSVPTTN